MKEVGKGTKQKQEKKTWIVTKLKSFVAGFVFHYYGLICLSFSKTTNCKNKKRKTNIVTQCVKFLEYS